MVVGIIIPFLVCVIGLVMYFAAANNAKVATVGLWSYVVGLLVTLMVVAEKMIKL